MQILQTQSPDDRLPALFSFAGQLGAGETIVPGSVSFLSGAAALVAEDPAIAGSDVGAWISGGAPNTVYALACLAQTSGGRLLVVEARIFIGPVGLDDPFAPEAPASMATPFVLAPRLVTGIVAAVGDQTTATALTGEWNIVTTVPGGGGVRLDHTQWPYQRVFNRCGTGQALLVYPDVGADVETLDVNEPISIADGSDGEFTWDPSA